MERLASKKEPTKKRLKLWKEEDMKKKQIITNRAEPGYVELEAYVNSLEERRPFKVMTTKWDTASFCKGPMKVKGLEV